jgi:hypothetical protein
LNSTAAIHLVPIAPRNALRDQPGLAAVLREGRIVSGRVLQRLGERVVLLGIEGQRVAARAALPLHVGQELALRVASSPEGWLLRILDSGSAPQSPLLAALRQWIGRGQPLSIALAEFARELRGLAAREDGALARSVLQQLAEHVLEPDGSAEQLRERLLRSGLAHEHALLAAGREPLRRAELLRVLERDLKSLLLRAQRELPPGPAQEAAEAALASIETEQLLQLARREAGDPAALEFVLQDGARWANARLSVERDGRRQPEQERERDTPAGEGVHARLALELSRLGGVRVELSLQAGRLELAIAVEDPIALRTLAGRLPELRERLSAPGRTVQLRALPLRDVEAAQTQDGLAGARLLQLGRMVDVCA